MVGMMAAAALIALLITSVTPTKPGRKVRQVAGRTTVAGAKQAARPVRYAGRRTRSAGIGWWGRAIVAAYDRADAAAESGDHGRARRWRTAGDVLLGEAPLRCHVRGCPQMWATPTVYEVVDHLREHRQAEREAAKPEPAAEVPAAESTPEPVQESAPAPATPGYQPPKVGDRHTAPGGRGMEWDGEAWTPVCSGCGIAMDDYSRDRWLRCKKCGVRAADDRPMPRPADGPLATVIQLHNNQEETVTASAETTSLTRAKDFATGMAAANESMIPQIELSKAHMAARQVTGRPLELCDELTEIYQTAAAKARELHAELARQDRLQEEYRANQDAGDKQFQSAE